MPPFRLPHTAYADYFRHAMIIFDISAAIDAIIIFDIFAIID
jgi:hypothetical protein